ncbi:MAG: class II glutamine amidotransferase [Bacteroidales bacterium]|jgi:amidophosphoribosyltransferase|nr:class II glutamine amidotransferase [Bacteroidales bacterium]MDI9592508.1 class II glutamine amidotransferase [Bacteroidota bacterium]OQC38289.1 MAG: Amidophosphoribosyltransferase precursor [Bacteroidetes bacterium ADurb.Bin041]HNV49663.1 class II glutamine amidotransferase [Bacteroidales bacterium]HNY58934.1 class II glutamine amidotransferase [Bacteroidales bacterium]
MSDSLHHECGIALLRLLKPLEFYQAKYGTPFYSLLKIHLMMQKQHNRGQDGAGLANLKLDIEPGVKYINRYRSNSPTPIIDIFNHIYRLFSKIQSSHPELLNDVGWLKKNIDFTGELFLGHLRYGTYGGHNIENVHPVLRENNWMTRSLVLAGNFNMTNVDELFNQLIELGQYPIETTDTITILEKIGHFLDEENEIHYQKYKKKGLVKKEITDKIASDLNIKKILSQAAKYWDGGYVIAGLLGHGDAFIMRDPSGIRPAFYYFDEEVAVAASERPVIQTSFNVKAEQIQELKPGHVLIIKKNGRITEEQFTKPKQKQACSFERIYFSRGTDKDIYKERKTLGKLLMPSILKSINYDLENTVFSYIPNTAAVAFKGLTEELNIFYNKLKTDQILELGKDANAERINKILSSSLRIEDIAVKDIKLRTFITQENSRNDLAGHVYDVTYGIIKEGVDNLVVIDDSIVRGTTLRQSIIRILDRLGPKKIIIASSAPQIRYPDCYGIDMTKLSEFVAFKAAIELLHDTRKEYIINEVYKNAKAQEQKPKEKIVNYVKNIYKPFTAQQISEKISEIVTPHGINSKIEIIYQSIEDLHTAIPNNRGDWYFTGNYPTPGGNKVVNRSFINYIENRNERAY